MFRSISLLVLVVTITTVLGTMMAWQPHLYAQGSIQREACRVFSQTNKIVCGKFLVFWQQHGGLRIFGYPISNEMTEILDTGDGPRTFTVQYFERAIFELHPENQPPSDVQLALVGAFQYQTRYPNGNLEGDLPLYPDATFLGVELGATPEIRITTFETRDSTQTIFSFYKNALTKKGWMVTSETSNSIGFRYDSRAEEPHTRYNVLIETTRMATGRTRAKLYFIANPPR